jgi:hypothetical protein
MSDVAISDPPGAAPFVLETQQADLLSRQSFEACCSCELPTQRTPSASVKGHSPSASVKGCSASARGRSPASHSAIVPDQLEAMFLLNDGGGSTTQASSEPPVWRLVRGPALSMFMIYTITLAIFPGFLSEDVASAQLGSWYPIWLFFAFGLADCCSRWSSIPSKVLESMALARYVLSVWPYVGLLCSFLLVHAAVPALARVSCCPDATGWCAGYFSYLRLHGCLLLAQLLLWCSF